VIMSSFFAFSIAWRRVPGTLISSPALVTRKLRASLIRTMGRKAVVSLDAESLAMIVKSVLPGCFGGKRKVGLGTKTNPSSGSGSAAGSPCSAIATSAGVPLKV
jgi:hypothetical protein